ncbi:MAG: glycosyltransferase family 9 protein [Acidobacteria bacterium]|nr:glycosyltransferase family 9 protein [Acidobacteriota bacterium]
MNGLRRVLRSIDSRLGCAALQLGNRLSRGREKAITKPIALADVRRVLVIRLDEVGDMVLTSPFLRELRAALPDARITLVVRPSIHNLVELCPYVDSVLTFDTTSRSAFTAAARARRFVRAHLQSGPFDLAIVPRWDDDPRFASVLAFVSGARHRVGYRERSLLTHVCDAGPEQHEVLRNLDLIRFMNAGVHTEQLELWLGATDEHVAQDLLASHGVQPGGFLLGLAPGAANARRRWPTSGFAEVAAWSLRTHGGHVVVVGGEGDRLLGEHLRDTLGPSVINAAGQATLRQTAALLKSCSLFVGNDSGPMHLAAASRIPVVEISCHPQGGEPDHNNSPLRFGPWGTRHVVLQPAAPLAPCRTACRAEVAHCIRGISATAVVAHAAALLSPAALRDASTA